MKEGIYKAILDYKSGFSSVEDLGSYYRLEDSRLPDMRAHNTVMIKPGIPLEESKDIISENLGLRKSKGCDFLTVTSYDPLSLDDMSFTDIQPEISLYELMSIDTLSSASIKPKEDAKVLIADDHQVLEAGRMIDIEANKDAMSEAFATKRIDRKIEVYRDKSVPLDIYVVFFNGEAVGNCELFLGSEFAQIEDFDILPRFQRIGLGSHCLKHLLDIAGSVGYKRAFLITDHFDSAKIMYEKRGFLTKGRITELLYNL